MTHYYLLGGICLGLAGSGWIVIACLAFNKRAYQCGRDEGFELGFEAGRARAKDPDFEPWWADAERQVEREREKIRGEENRP